MKVTSVDIHASNSTKVMTLSFKDPRSLNPYIAKAILGLDAEEITPKFYGPSNTPNVGFYELSLKKRDIVVQMALNPDFTLGKTYSMLRDDLYKLIASSRTGAVQLRFKDGLTTVAAISGFVTKVESPQFEKAQEVHLTIKCSDPMLKAFEQTTLAVGALNPLSTTITDDKSTAPHGFRFGVIFSANLVKFTIKDAVVPTWLFEVDLAGSPLVQFVSGDKLQFSSEHNNRYLHLVRGAVTTHLVDRITSTSIWPVIFPGVNTFVCSPSLSWEYITHYPTYWGV